MKFKIAVVQAKTNFTDVNQILNKIEKYAKKASGKAEIIVFPEYIISWNFEDKKDKYKKHFQKLAKKYKLDIVTGTMITEQNKRKYNTTYYIEKTGKVKATYKKINLWHPERPVLKSGKNICVFNTQYGKIGLTICWDLAFPELYRKMVKKGANIVICPSFWSTEDASKKGLKHNPNSEKLFVDACCTARAFENEIIHVFCNAAGKVTEKDTKLTLLGHSQITVPFKGCIKKLDHNREEMFIQEVNTDILKDAEKGYKIRKDLQAKKPKSS